MMTSEPSSHDTTSMILARYDLSAICVRFAYDFHADSLS